MRKMFANVLITGRTLITDRCYKVSRFILTKLTLLMLRLLHPKHKNAKLFENHLNPVMFVFIRKLLLSTHR